MPPGTPARVSVWRAARWTSPRRRREQGDGEAVGSGDASAAGVSVAVCTTVGGGTGETSVWVGAAAGSDARPQASAAAATAAMMMVDNTANTILWIFICILLSSYGPLMFNPFSYAFRFRFGTITHSGVGSDVPLRAGRRVVPVSAPSLARRGGDR